MPPSVSPTDQSWDNAFLQRPSPPNCTADTIDFSTTGIPQYKGAFAILIHNLLTRDECAAFLRAAVATHGNTWEQAMVNVGEGRQQLVSDVRNCDRIIWDDVEIASRIQRRIMPHLPAEIVTLKSKGSITGHGPVKRNETWRISRLNERLRMLKYTSGMFFREHCDGTYVTPDRKEVSFLTVHLYLNGGGAEDKTESDDSAKELPKDDMPLEGGSTRFFGHNMIDHFDIRPEAGSCLVFQHRNLLHSGEDVIQGTKYTMRTDVLYEKVI